MAQSRLIRSLKKYSLTLCLLLASLPPLAAATPSYLDRNIVYGVRNSMPLYFDVAKPTNPNGAAILLIQSAGWYSNYRDPATVVSASNGLLSAGYTVFIVWHSNPPNSTVPVIVTDVQRAVRYIRAYSSRWRVNPNRLAAFGASSAGHLSLMLATAGDDGNLRSPDIIERYSSRIATAVVINAPSDLRGWTTNPPAPIAAAAILDAPLHFHPLYEPYVSPIMLLDRKDPPILMIHGDSDELVSVDYAYRMFSVMQSVGVRGDLKIIEGGTHGLDADSLVEALTYMEEWLDQYLPVVP